MGEFMIYVYNAVAAALAWAMLYTGFPAEPAVLLAVLMVLDFASGLGRAYALQEDITSRKMKAGAFGKVALLCLPLVVALAAKGLGQDWQWLLSYVINLMILAELYSFTANVYAMRTKNDLPEFDVLALFARKVKGLAEDFLSRVDK